MTADEVYGGSKSAVPVWYVYVLRCADDTLYTGITTDVQRRIHEHNTDARLGARYTRARRPVTLHYLESAADRSAAARRESVIKRLSRHEKLALPTTGGQPRSLEENS